VTRKLWINSRWTWAECASTTSLCENRIVNKTTQQSPLQLMYNKQFKGCKNLKTFDEMCVVTTKKAIQGKLNDRGTVGLYVEYPDNHADDVYSQVKRFSLA
jgi:hypothetical protein